MFYKLTLKEKLAVGLNGTGRGGIYTLGAGGTTTTGRGATTTGRGAGR